MEIEEIYVHRDWNRHGKSFDADIAVLLFMKDATLTKNIIWPICLARSIEIDKVRYGLIVGWGTSIANGPTQLKPLKAELEIKNCDSTSGSTSSRNFCAQSRNSSACSCDSGNFNNSLIY